MLDDAGNAGIEFTDVGLRACVFGFDIAADGEVVAVLGDCLVVDDCREVGNDLAVGIFTDDGCDILGRQFVFVSLMHKEVRSIDKQCLVFTL